jgi:tetratricopeptide (TPR) repeat protein
MALTPLLPAERAHAAVSETRLKRLNFFYRFQQGRNYWNGNAYLEAASFFQSLMTQYQELPRPLQLQLDYYLGSSLHELGLDSWAEQHLVAPSREPFPPVLAGDALARLMAIRAARGESYEVSRLIEETLVRPLPPAVKQTVALSAAQAWYTLGDFRRVRDIVLGLDPQHEVWPRGRMLSATAMLQIGELDAALEDVRAVLALGDRLVEFRMQEAVPTLKLMEAQILFDQGDAAAALAAAARIDAPELGADKAWLTAWSQLQLERYLDGLETFRGFVNTWPDDPRSLEATVLGGYILLNLNRFSDSYAWFVTTEADFRVASQRLKAFRASFPSADAFESVISDPQRQRELPLPAQVLTWIEESREVRRLVERQRELDELGIRIQDLVRDVQKMRVISAGFGTSFENPATLERLLRNEFGLRLTLIRSRILELMVKPVRRTLQSDEYRIVNLAQDTRRETLKAIRDNANVARDQAVGIQRSLQRIRDYVAMVAAEEVSGQPDPARKTDGDVAQLEARAQIVLDRLHADEEGLALVLLKIIEDEERLWSVVDATIRLERQSVGQALRRLGLWGRQPYLDRLEQLYRATEGIDELLQENGRLLLDIQKFILTDVLQYVGVAEREIRELAGTHEELGRGAHVMRVAAVDSGWRGVQAMVDERESQAAAGRLDVGWRANEVEESLVRNVQDARDKRLAELDAYYARARAAAEEAGARTAAIDEKLRSAIENTARGSRSLALDEALQGLMVELQAVEGMLAELQSGSTAILERPGNVGWQRGGTQ